MGKNIPPSWRRDKIDRKTRDYLKEVYEEIATDFMQLNKEQPNPEFHLKIKDQCAEFGAFIANNYLYSDDFVA